MQLPGSSQDFMCGENEFREVKVLGISGKCRKMEKRKKNLRARRILSSVLILPSPFLLFFTFQLDFLKSVFFPGKITKES